MVSVQATNSVVVEFFYWNPYRDPYTTCPECWAPIWEEYQNKSMILDNIEDFYGDKILTYRIDYRESEYDFRVQANSFVFNHEFPLEGRFTEDDVKQIIEAYLAETPLTSPPLPTLHLATTLALAFTFGFFETFSPCLVILLSFVLSYTIDKNSQFGARFAQVMAFAVGFVAATILVFSALALGLVVLSLMLGIQHVLIWVVGVFAMLFGLNLLGFDVLRFFGIRLETRPLMKKLTKKYVSAYPGLVALGFIFYFLDPCLAPVFVAMISAFSPTVLLEFLPLILFAFGIGVMIPFIGIGVLAGSISKLARSTYRHKAKIRAISGLILVVYALYLLFSILTF